jgi:hypothetical protein
MTLAAPDGPLRDLGFPDEVRTQFQFLEALGFELRESGPTCVRYTRAEFVIEIYHGRQSYELGLNLMRYGVSYSLETLLAVHERAGGATTFHPFAATDRDAVAAGVGHLAGMFKSCSDYFLANDPVVFRAVDDYGEEVSARLAIESLARQLRPKAEAAFKAKDYRLAAELYGQVRDQLTPAEIAKLKFAISHS